MGRIDTVYLTADIIKAIIDAQEAGFESLCICQNHIERKTYLIDAETNERIREVA